MIDHEYIQGFFNHLVHALSSKWLILNKQREEYSLYLQSETARSEMTRENMYIISGEEGICGCSMLRAYGSSQTQTSSLGSNEWTCAKVRMQVAWLDLWGAWKGGAALGTSIYDVSIPKFFDLMVMAGIPRTKLVKDTQHTHARTHHIFPCPALLLSLLYRGSSLSCSVDHRTICIWQQYIRNFPVVKQILSRWYMCMQPVSQTFKSTIMLGRY
jgi:hypothetical protein